MEASGRPRKWIAASAASAWPCPRWPGRHRLAIRRPTPGGCSRRRAMPAAATKAARPIVASRRPAGQASGTGCGARTRSNASIMAHYNRYCIRCHGVDGRGVWDIPDVPDFTDPRWQASRSDAQIVNILMEGRGAVMPTFRGTLTLEESWAMAPLPPHLRPRLRDRPPRSRPGLERRTRRSPRRTAAGATSSLPPLPAGGGRELARLRCRGPARMVPLGRHGRANRKNRHNRHSFRRLAYPITRASGTPFPAAAPRPVSDHPASHPDQAIGSGVNIVAGRRHISSRVVSPPDRAGSFTPALGARRDGVHTLANPNSHHTIILVDRMVVLGGRSPGAGRASRCLPARRTRSGARRRR